MKHLDDVSVDRLARGDWTEPAGLEAQVHLSSCVRCREAVDDLRSSLRAAASGVTNALGPPRADNQTRTSAPGARPASVTAAPPAGLSKGALVGRYVVLDVLGEGGMGQVYAAYDPELSRKVALKLLLPDYVESGDASLGRARLQREAQAMAQLSHPHVVNVYDVGSFGTQVFVAMELVEGQTLKAWLNEKPRAWNEVLAAFKEAGQGLAAAHAAGLVHRDFKPDNVLMTAGGHAKVTDFGLARPAGVDGLVDGGSLPPSSPVTTPSGGVQVVTPITQAGNVVGTLAYMAPEQMLGKAPEAKGDIFSFAVALYEGLYGQRPFAGKTLQELIEAINRGEVREPARGRDVPAWLRRVVVKGLAATPDARSASMDDFLLELGKDPARRRRRVFAVSTALAVVVASWVGVWSFVKRAPPPCPSAKPRLQGVWDDQARAAMGSAFKALPVPYAADTWQRVEKSLDTYATDWLAAVDQTCRATKIERHQSEELHQLRALCLDRQHLQWQALMDVFKAPKEKTVEKAITAVASLGSPRDCSAEEVLKDPKPPRPSDPAAAARVEAQRPSLAKARALSEAGDFKAADALLAPVLTELEAVGDEPVLAEAILLQSQMAQMLGGAANVASLRARAAALALSSRQYRLLAKAANGAARAFTIEGTEGASTARGWLDVADAAIRSLGNSPELRADYFGARTMWLGYSGEHAAEALASSREGVEFARQQLPELSPNAISMLVTHLTTLGCTQPTRATRPELLALAREAMDRSERLYGFAHPEHARSLVSVCSTLQQAGASLEQTTPWCEKARASAEKAFSPESMRMALLLIAEAEALARKGHLTEARAQGAAYAQLIEKLNLPENPFGVWFELLEADIAYLEGAPKDALPFAIKAIAAYGEATQDVDVLRALTLKGWALLRLGKPKEAVGPLRAAVERWSNVIAYAGCRARARFHLAEAMALTGGDPKAARGYAEQALAEYREFDRFSDEGKEVEDWLARQHGFGGDHQRSR